MTRVPEHIPRIGIDEIKKCALCARGVMHDDHLHFYRASLGQGLIHVEGVRRAQSMEDFFQGHTAMARVFHDGTPVAFEVWRAKDLWICQACVHRPIAELIEAANRPVGVETQRAAENTEEPS